MPRATTDILRARLKLLTGDPVLNGGFSEDDLEWFLDQHREFFPDPVSGWYDLSPFEAAAPWQTFQASLDAWERDLSVVVNSAGVTQALDAAGTFPDRGIFKLAAGVNFSVYLRGWTFDLHLSAADVLEAWARKVARDFDVSADGRNFSRSQKHKQLLESAKRERASARVGVVAFGRSDGG